MYQTNLIFESDATPESCPDVEDSALLSESPALDDPPRFCFHANPHFADLCNPSDTAETHTEPYNKNISAGKNSFSYYAHSYHTKVPPDGIKHIIEYYTNPGDTVLDPFCGSGMTGIAALESGRQALLSDLSPAATFLTYNHIFPAKASAYEAAVNTILSESQPLERYLYQTQERETGRLTTSLYTVWSHGVICKHCSTEVILWDVTRKFGKTVRDSKILSEFHCPQCGEQQKKRGLKRTKRYPVQVGYPKPEGGLQEAMSAPTDFDLDKLAEIENRGVPEHLWHPTTPIPDGVNTRQPMAAGITSVDKFYTTRALWAVAHLWAKALAWPDPKIRSQLLFTITSLYKRITVCSEFRFWGGSGNTANFNVPAIMNEQNVFRAFERKAKTIARYLREAPAIDRHARVSCQSACDLSNLPDGSVDYIFTDPPFGGNINYSEVNLIWEAWIAHLTDTTDEAIINKVQNKDVNEYQELLRRAFSEMGRVLKEGGWATIVFHNSSAQVWSALQSAVIEAGFDVRAAQTFDKQHGTFKQFVSENAVGYDIVLHCQKTANATNILAEGKAPAQHARKFVADTLRASTGGYIKRFLHVKRAPEFDYRRLYAEWLRHAFGEVQITIGFEDFRQIVDEVRGAT